MSIGTPQFVRCTVEVPLFILYSLFHLFSHLACGPVKETSYEYDEFSVSLRVDQSPIIYH